VSTSKTDILGQCVAVLLGALLPASVPAFAQDRATIDCTGPFARNSDEDAVAKAFGAVNVEQADIDIGEGMTERGTVVFPKDPRWRIEILWHDGEKRRRPHVVMFRDGSAWQVPIPGTTDARIAIGDALAQVEAANGKPFTILGFGWDNGGYAADWGGGRLDRPVGGCSLSLRFDADRNAPPAALEEVSGDKEFRSSEAAVRATGAIVFQIEFRWPIDR
jgi:hypothetical protein